MSVAKARQRGHSTLVLSARDLAALPDDTGDRAEWKDEETNRNIDHAEAARLVTTRFVSNSQRSSECAFNQLRCL
jgi:hypothetical protein